MKIEYDEKENTVKMSDMFLTAALLSEYPQDVELKGTVESEERAGQKLFVLQGDMQIVKNAVRRFFSGRFSVANLQGMIEQFRALKRLLFENV